MGRIMREYQVDETLEDVCTRRVGHDWRPATDEQKGRFKIVHFGDNRKDHVVNGNERCHRCGRPR